MDQLSAAAAALATRMPTRDEHQPGQPAPKSGVYRLLNVFGGEEATRVTVRRGETLPAAPRGYSWRLVRETDDAAPA